MRIKLGSFVSIGVVALVIGLFSMFIRNSENRDELKYWLEYHSNRLGILEKEHKN
jgi:hypothetical protein